MNSGTRATWSCTSIVAMGSCLAENSNNSKVSPVERALPSADTSMSEISTTEGSMTSLKLRKAMVRLKLSLLLAWRSIGVPSICGGTISRPWAARATSRLSGALHMANSRPPLLTHPAMAAATACFSAPTDGKPSACAICWDDWTWRRYHGVWAKVVPKRPNCPLKSSWCRCSQSKSASFPSSTSRSQTVLYSIWAYSSATRTASSHGSLSGGTYTATRGARVSCTRSMLPCSMVRLSAARPAASSGCTDTPIAPARARASGASGSRKLPAR